MAAEPAEWQGSAGGEDRCTAGCQPCGALREALLDALAERDIERLDARAVSAGAGLDPGALEEHYGSLDRCLLAAFDELAFDLYRCAVDALDGPGDWHERLVGCVDASLEQLESIPGAARLWFSEGAGTTVMLVNEHRVAARQRFVAFLADRYRREQDPDMPDVHFEFLMGALYRAAMEELAAGGDPARVRGRVRELLGVLEPVPA